MSRKSQIGDLPTLTTRDNRIGRADAECVASVLRHLKVSMSQDLLDDEKRQASDLFQFLIDFLSERVDAENCLVLWKLGEDLNSERLICAAISAVQVVVLPQIFRRKCRDSQNLDRPTYPF